MFNKSYLILLSTLTTLNYTIAEIKIIRDQAPGHVWYKRKEGNQIIVVYKNFHKNPATKKYIVPMALWFRIKTNLQKSRMILKQVLCINI